MKVRTVNFQKVKIMKIKKVIISGGGTGGHVFPAIAIADQIKHEFPNAELLFVGAKGKLEMTKVPEAGYEIEGLWISGLQRRWTWKNLLLPLKIISSLWKTRKIIKRFQPDVVVGVGGYASLPTLKMANMMQFPTVVQEQNSYPGKTNIYLSKAAHKMCVAYEGMNRFFPEDKIELTGNPVRKKVVKIDGLKEKGRTHFKLKNDLPTVLVVGGSLGARTLNESFVNKIKLLQEGGIQMIWQCGRHQFEEMKALTRSIDMTGISLNEFIEDIELAYAAADVIISRAGAIAISEMQLAGKPTILVPSPNVAEDHQTKNAEALVKNDAAILVKDKNARAQLIPVLIDLISDKKQQESLAENIQKNAIINADERIVEVIKQVVK